MNIEGFKTYLAEQERANNTISSYCLSVRMFYHSHTVISTENLVAFKRELMARVSPATVNLRLCGIQMYAKFIGSAASVKKIKTQRAGSVENVITRDEFGKLCEGLENDGKRKGCLAVKFLAMTGVRAAEFCELRKSCLDKRYQDINNKGKVRRVYIPAKLIEDSGDYFAGVKGDFLFPGKHGGKLTTHGLASNIAKWGAKYGVRKEAAHPHAFRHYFAKNFISAGGDLSLLSDLLGHSSIATTAIYTRRSKDEVAAELSRIIGVSS